MARMAIDARMCAYRRGGIASYTRQLATALVPELAARNHIGIIGYARCGSPVLPRQSRADQPKLWTPPHHRMEPFTLPIEFLRSRPALMHSPDFLPIRGPWQTIITVHDLDFVRHPARLTPDAQRYYGQIGTAVHRADAIIAVSKATRDDLISLLGVDADAVWVIDEAADALFRPPNDNASPVTASNRDMPSRYFLMVGTIEPRKNHDTLLDAYAAYRRTTDNPAALVIVGAEGWHAAATVARLRSEAGVLWLGPATSAELLPLYHGALALLMPSWDEGFGLPVVEAMASGTPVAISTARALIEVAGDAALAIAPDDVRGWAAAMATLATTPWRRAALRAAGYQRAAHYSWERAARETANLYDHVLRPQCDQEKRRRKRAH